MIEYLIEQSENFIKLGLEDLRIEPLITIKDRLYHNPDVALVRFVEAHPDLEDRQFSVSTYKGNAKEALIKATDEVIDYFSEINVTNYDPNNYVTSNDKEPYGLKGKKPEPYGLKGKKPEPYGLKGKKPEPYGLNGN